MSKINTLATAAALALITALPQAAMAGNEVTIYPFAASHNFCPAGLQPVTISGTVCCGTPTTNVSYQHMKAHPVARKTHRVTHKVQRVQHSSRDCPIGTKGCTFD